MRKIDKAYFILNGALCATLVFAWIHHADDSRRNAAIMEIETAYKTNSSDAEKLTNRATAIALNTESSISRNRSFYITIAMCILLTSTSIIGYRRSRPVVA